MWMKVTPGGSVEYRTNGGTKYTCKNDETVGRIHSVNVGPKPPTIKVTRRRMTTTYTKMKYHVTKTRQPIAKARKSSQSSGALRLSDDFVAQLVIHIVRPHLDEDVMFGKRMIVEEEIEEQVVMQEQESMPSKISPVPRRNLRIPDQKDKAGGKLTDFEEIMRRRKNQVDTMDNTGRLMRELSSHTDGVSAGRKRSKLWSMVRESLKDKTYLTFTHKRMGSFS